MSMGLPRPTRYVTWLLVANIGIFVFSSLFPGLDIEYRFSLTKLAAWDSILEGGRLITYQFLHADVTHLLFNMLGVYFFGPALERYWGSTRFLFFYLFCGVVGGLTFLLISAFIPGPAELIGASGAVLGLLAACAVLFPQMIIVLILFPVPIRFAAILLAAIYTLNVISKRDLADACHLGGMAAGFLYLKARPFWDKFSYQRTAAKRQALMDLEAEDQRNVDQILEKVHQNGIQSLTRREKNILRDITQRQKLRDDLRKKGRL